MGEAVRLIHLEVEPDLDSQGNAHVVTVKVSVMAASSFEAGQWMLSAVENA